MRLDDYLQSMLPAIEDELKAVVYEAQGEELQEMLGMLAYHLGWQGQDAGPKAMGKRVRPFLLALCTHAAGGDWHKALPAAAAVELLHNFSLIHDDIQDNSETRRGRPTLWVKWGVPQAINAGDAMFALAHIALERLGRDNPAEVYLQASRLLPRTSLHLTKGQYLDLAYEQAQDLDVADYWPMVQGKTAILLSTCSRLGALVAGCQGQQLDDYTQFGEKLGLAFQAYDDLLGIWGETQHTGKSAHSDLLSGKKSLPVLYGLSQGGEFARRWKANGLKPAEVEELARMLEDEGGKAFAEQEAERLTQGALDALDAAEPQAESGAALREFAYSLVQRKT